MLEAHLQCQPYLPSLQKTSSAVFTMSQNADPVLCLFERCDVSMQTMSHADTVE